MTCVCSSVGFTGFGIRSTGISHCRQYILFTLLLEMYLNQLFHLWRNFWKEVHKLFSLSLFVNSLFTRTTIFSYLIWKHHNVLETSRPSNLKRFNYTHASRYKYFQSKFFQIWDYTHLQIRWEHTIWLTAVYFTVVFMKTTFTLSFKMKKII